MEVFSSATQPSRIGLGSISGAPAPGGRIWKSTCASAPPVELPRRPSTVPAITRTPACSGCRYTSFGPARKLVVAAGCGCAVAGDDVAVAGAAGLDAPGGCPAPRPGEPPSDRAANDGA